MADYSPHQKKIIDRYYDHRDEIMLTKLEETVTDLFLADSDKKRDRLWKRVDQAMTQIKVPPSTRKHILSSRSIEALARNVREWLQQAKKSH